MNDIVQLEWKTIRQRGDMGLVAACPTGCTVFLVNSVRVDVREIEYNAVTD